MSWMWFNKTFCIKFPHGKVEETNMTVHIILVTGKADSGTWNMLAESPES